jgi:hypothetical protein
MKTFNDDILLFLLFSGVGFGTDSSIEGTPESELGLVQSNYLEGKHPLKPMVYLSTKRIGISLLINVILSLIN